MWADVWQFAAQQMTRQAGYVLREVAPLLAELLQQQQAEVSTGPSVGGWGFGRVDSRDVPLLAALLATAGSWGEYWVSLGAHGWRIAH